MGNQWLLMSHHHIINSEKRVCFLVEHQVLLAELPERLSMPSCSPIESWANPPSEPKKSQILKRKDGNGPRTYFISLGESKFLVYALHCGHIIENKITNCQTDFNFSVCELLCELLLQFRDFVLIGTRRYMCNYNVNQAKWK